MKKILSTALLLIAVVCFTSCYSNTPSGVVKKAFNCERKGDMKGYWELMSTSDVPSVDKSNREYYLEETSDYEVKIIKNDCKMIKDFKIVSEEIDKNHSDKAEVEIKYKIRDREIEHTVYLRKCDDGKWRVIRYQSGASGIFF